LVGGGGGLGGNQQDVVEGQSFFPEFPVELEEPLDLTGR